MWNWSSESKDKLQQELIISLQAQDRSILQENDFLKIINLEERYNYLKSLIKLQRLNNFSEEMNQTNLIKIMHQLIEYYSQCISQAELNKENIIMYFQQKMKDLNYHYKSIMDKQKIHQLKAMENELKKDTFQLGQIQETVSIFSIQQELLIRNQQHQLTNKMKNNHNKSLMVAIQNQNIQQHLTNNIKKVDFLKKSIATSIQNQQTLLQNRILHKRKKLNNEKSKLQTPQSVSTAATFQKKVEKTIKRKKEAYSSFHTTYHSKISSDSELDEADNLYLSTFNVEDNDNFNRSQLHLSA